MENDFETLEIEEISPQTNGLQVYQQDKALIDIQISTAKRYPRNLQKSIENAIIIATMDKETAESCTYTLKKGGKTITGPSVNLAKIIAQQMGNMRIENRVVGYEEKYVTCEAICFDLERNFAIRTQIKRSIFGNSGRYSEDLCVIVGNAGNSIALRNAVFTVIDKAVINKVYNAAKKKITGDISDETKFLARRNLLFDGLKSRYSDFKLTDLEICNSVGKQVIDHIDKDDIVTLIGFENTLKKGEQTFESIFRPVVKAERVKPPDSEQKSNERILKLIVLAKTRAEIEKLKKDCVTTEASKLYDEVWQKLK